MLSGNKKYANEILDDIECYKAVLDGRLKQFPKGFWTKPWSVESAIVITRYLLEERLGYTEEDIKTRVKISTFQENKLTGALKLFNNSPYNIINNIYKNRFKPWEFRHVPRGFWEDENNIKQAVKWLVETKLDNNRQRVCNEFNQGLLLKHGVVSMATYGIYNILNITYPNEFKQWELGAVSDGFFSSEENIIQAVRWLVETKLDNNKERVKKEFNTNLLANNGLNALGYYGIYKSLDLAYPNEFKPWELQSVSNKYWSDRNNVIEAVKWLVETKLDNNKERVYKEFNTELLRKHGMATLSQIGLFNILDMAYPNDFNANDFNKFRNR